MTTLPDWARDITARYESGANNQFLLHGNVEDRFVLPGAGGLGTLGDFLNRALLGRFDVVLSYDLGSGIRIEKGNQTFSQWPGFKANPVFPREARPALETFTHYARYCANLGRLGQPVPRVAVVVRAVQLVAPQSPYVEPVYGALALLLREWSLDSLIHDSPFASFLIAENLSDVHPLVVNNPRAATFKIPLPTPVDISGALTMMAPLFPKALQNFKENLGQLSGAMAGATLSSFETLLKTREHGGKPLENSDLVTLKKQLIENDAGGLIEFVESSRSLDDYSGAAPIKKWLRADLELWKQGDLAALPMGYLLCGPVGTGKTFLVECLAGEAGVPVVKIKNFRDKWIGSTEGNLEKIFRLLGALGRCFVFIDEADQSLGKRESDSGDSGISGRVYGMFAQEMSRGSNRGKIIWILASSRPDLIEVDLKRPGRIDVKIPIFPTTTARETFDLIRSLCKRRDMDIPESDFEGIEKTLPLLLTPGAAEALAVKVYRESKVEKRTPSEVLKNTLLDYQPPIDPVVLAHQMDLAIKEASDPQFVPETLRVRK